MNTELQAAISGVITLVLGNYIKQHVDKKWVATLALVIGVILNAVYAQLTGGTLASALAPGLAGGATAISIHEVISNALAGVFKPKP